MINVIQLILLISLLLEKEQSMIAATRNQTYAMLRTPPMMPMNEFMVLLPRHYSCVNGPRSEKVCLPSATRATPREGSLSAWMRQ